MQVLGDLICLPPSDDDRLPLPWWHRAPLGFYTKTSCHWCITTSGKRPVGDLIISVLDPEDIKGTFRIKCAHPDSPGVVSKVLNVTNRKNVALAESVTIDAGSTHEVTLFCEAVTRPESRQIKAGLAERGFQIVSADFCQQYAIKFADSAEVNQGWITLGEWRERLLESARSANKAQNIDLSRAVVSADTRNRLLRFVFPYKHARTIRIRHSDRIGVLEDLTKTLRKRHLNILSMVLRRGGVPAKQAMLVVVCEPKDGHRRVAEYETAKKELRKLKSVKKVTINSGIMAPRSVTPASAYTVVATPPDSMMDYIARERGNVPASSTPVFCSHRFPGDVRTSQLVNEVKSALDDQHCHMLVSGPTSAESYPDINPQIYSQVSALMWIARAGIVLIAGPTADAIGKNVPHEFGFLQGQRKPILLLVEGYARERLKDWSTIEGVLAQLIPEGDDAFMRNNPKSVYATITRWCNKLRSSQLI